MRGGSCQLWEIDSLHVFPFYPIIFSELCPVFSLLEIIVNIQSPRYCILMIFFNIIQCIIPWGKFGKKGINSRKESERRFLNPPCCPDPSQHLVAHVPSFHLVIFFIILLLTIKPTNQTNGQDQRHNLLGEGNK